MPTEVRVPWSARADVLLHQGPTKTKPIPGTPVPKTTRLEWASLGLAGAAVQTNPTGTIRPGALAGYDPSATYAVPSGTVVHLSPNGVDTNDGTTLAKAVRTLARAKALVPVGGTVVAHEGVYEAHGALLTPSGYTGTVGFLGFAWDKASTTIQAAPGEDHPIFDGSRRHTGWTQTSSSPNVWTKTAAISFDRGHTDSYGKLDNDVRGEGWTWVRPDFPLAANPEAVFVDDRECEQVATAAAANRENTFHVAGTSSGLNNVLFTSSVWTVCLPAGVNPNTADTRIAECYSALTANATDVTLKGIRFRRYANSNAQGGMVKGIRARFTLENVLVEDVATVGMSLFEGDGSSFTQCEAQRCGILGFKAHTSYQLSWLRCKAEFCNIRRFYWAPVTGGIKLTACRDVEIRDGSFCRNWTKGLWFDASNYNVDVISCALDWNEQFGIVFEIGAKSYLLGCTITNNGKDGILWHDTHDLKVWCCSFKNNGRLRRTGIYDDSNPRNIRVFQDNRRAVDDPSTGGVYPDYGRDGRQPVPDPTMNNWLIESMEICNNVLDQGKLQFTYYPIEDLQKNEGFSRDVSDYGLTAGGNLLCRAASTEGQNWNGSVYQPLGWAWIAPGVGTAQTIHTTLASWRSRTGQDGDSVEVIGATVTDADGWLTSSARAAYQEGGANPVGRPLPAAVATRLGVTAGRRHVGPFESAVEAPTTSTWQVRLRSGSTAAPQHLYFPGDSSWYGAANYGNTTPKALNNTVGQLQTLLAPTYGQTGRGTVLANNDTKNLPTLVQGVSNGVPGSWDPRWSWSAGVTTQALGWHGAALYRIPAGEWVEFVEVCSSYVVSLLRQTAGVCTVTIDGAAAGTVQSSSTAASRGILPGRHANHLVSVVPAGSLGSHRIRLTATGGTVDLAMLEPVSGTDRLVAHNPSVSGKNLGTAGFGAAEPTDGSKGPEWFRTLFARGPGAAMLALLTNEWTAGNPLATIASRIDAEVALYQQFDGSSSARPLIQPFGFVQPQPRTDLGGGGPTYTEVVNLALSKGQQYGYPVFNGHKLFAGTTATDEATLFNQGNAAGYYADGIHPNNKGSALLASELIKFLGL